MTSAISPQRLPIIFVLGLSGAGKSTLGDSFQEKFNYLHIEQDGMTENGIDKWGFRAEWNNHRKFFKTRELTEKLERLAQQYNRVGVILTFDSTVTPTVEEIARSKNAGINTVILLGTKEECLASFLNREQSNGRNLDEAHWHRYNTVSYKRFNKPEYLPYLLSAFTKGRHKDTNQLTKEVLGRS